MPYFRSQEASSPPDTTDPFSIIVAGDSKGYFWGVINNSYLTTTYLDVAAQNGIPILGLLKENPFDVDKITNKENGWRALLQNDLIWIEYDVVKKRAEIKSYGAGDKLDLSYWSIKNGLVEFNQENKPGTPQSFARRIIAAATTDDNGYPLIEQAFQSHQILKTFCYQGVPYVYPTDLSGIINTIDIIQK